MTLEWLASRMGTPYKQQSTWTYRPVRIGPYVCYTDGHLLVGVESDDPTPELPEDTKVPGYVLAEPTADAETYAVADLREWAGEPEWPEWIPVCAECDGTGEVEGVETECECPDCGHVHACDSAGDCEACDGTGGGAWSRHEYRRGKIAGVRIDRVLLARALEDASGSATAYPVEIGNSPSLILAGDGWRVLIMGLHDFSRDGVEHPEFQPPAVA